MRILEFECPRTERVVSTRIKVDEVSYKAISHSTTYIHCPYCPLPDRLAHVRSWRGESQESTSDESQRSTALSRSEPRNWSTARARQSKK
jgi:hypothetical protein